MSRPVAARVRALVRRRARAATAGRPGAPSPVRLLVAFAMLLLVPVLVLGVALNHVYQTGTAQRTLDDARSSARLLAQSSVQPAIAGQDLDAGLDIAGVSDLGASVDAAVRDGQVVRLRLMAPDGNTVFPPQELGTFPDAALSADLAATADGDAPARLSTAALPSWLGGSSVRVVQVYAPVVAPDGRKLGTVEVALPYERVAQRAERQTALFGVVLLGGLFGLYAVVAVLAWVVTGRLRRQLVATDHLAHHDPLTGLPNRAMFRLRAHAALEPGERGVAVAILDLDRFKQVNDTLGHESGDVLLVEVGRRLLAAVRTDDTVARLGGDEFGLVMPGLDAAGASALLSGVTRALAAPCRVGGRLLPISGSIGVSAAPEHGTTIEELLRHADVAMYAAKRSNRDVVASEAQPDGVGGEGALDQLLLEAELTRALAHDELVLHYQPLTDLDDGRVSRLEALVRWQHPTRGLLGPGLFLPLAETTGQIGDLTWWVLRHALADLASLRDDVGVAVNVSPSTLRDHGFCDRVVQMLAAADQPPARLQLEMTESSVIEELDAVRATLDRLAAAGIALSLDDFGQGSTSLGFLGVLPFTEIKVDRAFVVGLGAPGLARTIVASIVSIAHEAGMRVVAEGIESAEVLDRVRELGCDAAQGYHLGRPAPLARRVGPPPRPSTATSAVAVAGGTA